MKYLPSWQVQSIEDWATEAAESICDDIEEQTVFLERNPVVAFVRYLSDWFEAQLADDDYWEENIEDDELRRIHARAEAIRLVANSSARKGAFWDVISGMPVLDSRIEKVLYFFFSRSSECGRIPGRPHSAPALYQKRQCTIWYTKKYIVKFCIPKKTLSNLVYAIERDQRRLLIAVG